MNTPPHFLTKTAIIAIHQQQIARFGGTLGIRDETLLESALGTAAHCWHYTEDIFQTAAQYCISLARNHAFLDGNKRVAAAAMLVFLILNNIQVKMTPEQLYDWTIAVATSQLVRADLAVHLRSTALISHDK